ncbi:MAG: RimJ/RimL family protein N-acetyltransferase, partial [bacterium]
MQNIVGELLPEIGYMIHEPFWKQGFAYESVCAV